MVSAIDKSSLEKNLEESLNPKSSNDAPYAFDQKVQPTNIDLPNEDHGKKVEIVEKVSELERNYLVDRSLKDYIGKLSKERRKLRVLGFEFDYAKSDEDVEKLLSEALDAGDLSQDEYDTALSKMKGENRVEIHTAEPISPDKDPASHKIRINVLRDKIKQAEKAEDESKVLELENELRGAEVDHKNETRESVIREQINRVKAVENTDEKAYERELAKLRVMEGERGGDKVNIAEAVKEPDVSSERPVEGQPIVRLEDKEKLEAQLNEARKNYAKLQVDWEYKSRNSKRLFARTLESLGVTRPTPERLSIKTSPLEDARETYEKLLKMNGVNIEGEKRNILISEKLALQSLEQDFREEKETFDKENKGVIKAIKAEQKREDINEIAETIKKARELWGKMKPQEGFFVSSAILAGTDMTIDFGPMRGFEGLRVERTEPIKNSVENPTGNSSNSKEDKDKEEVIVEPKAKIETVTEEVPEISTSVVSEPETTTELSNSDLIQPIDSEDGKIRVVKNEIGDLTVFLGEIEIAKGSMTSKGPNIKIKEELKGGWFMADNEFEKAFKTANKALKSK